MSAAPDDLLLQAATDLFARHCTPRLVADSEAAGWSPELWSELVSSGLASIGTDGSRLEAAGVVRIAARFAAPVPLAETVMASWLLIDHGLPVPAGPLTVVTEGRAPYAAIARGLVVHHELVSPEDCRIESLPPNLAGEPWSLVDPSGPIPWLQPIGTLIRSVQIAGALDAILALTIDYVRDRRQFGSSLSRFQAVQQQLALLAAEVAAAGAAVDAALEQPGLLSVASAKIRCGQAAGRSAEIAHQLHGAIGYTDEHRLHLFTRRLWSWRDEFGSETEWAARLGALLAREGPDRFWEAIT